MSTVITIAGSVRTTLVRVSDISLQKRLGQRTVLTATVQPTVWSERPAPGDEVTVTIDSTAYFGGVILATEERTALDTRFERRLALPAGHWQLAGQELSNGCLQLLLVRR